MLSFQTEQEELTYGQVALIVHPSGAIDDKLTVRQLRKQLQDYFNVGFRFLIMDCNDIDTINSDGLQVLSDMVDTYHEGGGIFLLIKVLRQITGYFEGLDYSPVFTSFLTKEDASAFLIDSSSTYLATF